MYVSNVQELNAAVIKRVLSPAALGVCSITALYLAVNKLVLDRVHITSNTVIDEAFHIPQGLEYCNYDFSRWNPKITTLPGLYLITAALLGPLNLCSIYWLRFLNLAASAINFCLLYYWLTLEHKKDDTCQSEDERVALLGPWKNMLLALNLTLLPPLYFFNFLYYTETVSLTFVLLAFVLAKRNEHKVVSLCGLASVIVRQTNILWIMLIMVEYVLATLQSIFRFTFTSLEELRDCLLTVGQLRKNFHFTRGGFTFIANVSSYIVLSVSFLYFIFSNNGIVVGDRDAHHSTIHLPQILYFSLFYVIFTWPYIISDIIPFAKHIMSRRTFFLTALLFSIFAVYSTTVVHPYLLADNRHYTFYMWNRFYGKYHFFRYLMVPVYYFGWYSMLSKFHKPDSIPFCLSFLSVTFLGLAMHGMIEIRYFLIPYIIIRVKHSGDIKLWQLLVEFVYFSIINTVAFAIFFTKEIYWTDFTDVQRLIW